MKQEEEIDPRIKAIADKIKALRIKSGNTNHEHFAYDHDINRVQYNRMEKGTNFTITSLLKILDIHKISLQEFFSEGFEDIKKGT